MIAASKDLDDRDPGFEPGDFGRCIDRPEYVIRRNLSDAATLCTRQYDLGPLNMVDRMTGEIGVPAFETMDHASVEQHIKGTIHADRGEPSPVTSEPVDNLVSTDRMVGRSDLTEYIGPQLRESQPTRLEHLASPLDAGCATGGVVVPG